mgnify:CR=1 FL=1
MFKIAIASIFALAALFPPALAAQPPEHVVKARVLLSRESVRPGETFAAAVILEIQAGYHINDNAPLDEFMIPTTLAVAGHADFEILETLFPAGRPARFEYSEAELAVYEGEVVIGLLLKAKAKASPGAKTLEASVGYQACDNATCLPPKELSLVIAVPVAASGGSAIHSEVFEKLRFRSLHK